MQQDLFPNPVLNLRKTQFARINFHYDFAVFSVDHRAMSKSSKIFQQYRDFGPVREGNLQIILAKVARRRRFVSQSHQRRRN